MNPDRRTIVQRAISQHAAPWALVAALMLAGAPLPGADENSEQGNKTDRPKPPGRRTNQTTPQAEDSSGSRSSRRERRSDTGNNAAATNPAGGAAAPAADGKPAAAAPAGRPAAAQPAARPAAPKVSALGQFQLNVDKDARLLRIHPKGASLRQDLSVTIGDEFVTEISLNNTDLTGFDEIRVLLSYESDFVEPLAINDSVLAPLLKGEPTSELDPLFGQILYEAQLVRPLAVNDSPILSIRWKAIKVTVESAIEFSKREEVTTAVNGEGKDLLGNPKEPGDGTLNMTVTILPEDPREAEALLTDPKTFSPRSLKVGGARLFLLPPTDPVVVDQPFAVDVVLDNKAFSMLDNVGVRISYDPQVLEILDADWNNWITLGVNIHDGPFRTAFPWNYHVENMALPKHGEIRYRVGTDDVEFVRGKAGSIARIYAVAKEPTAATTLKFMFSDQPRDRATQVTYVGADALGDPDVPGDGAQGLVLRVHPAPRTSAEAKPAR